MCLNKLCLPVSTVKTYTNPLDWFLGLLVRMRDMELKFIFHQS